MRVVRRDGLAITNANRENQDLFSNNLIGLFVFSTASTRPRQSQNKGYLAALYSYHLSFLGLGGTRIFGILDFELRASHI